MPTKAYVILYNQDLIEVPIKSDTNPYDPNIPWYCRGMPQFFGGNVDGFYGEGEIPLGVLEDHLKKEIAEESRRSLALNVLYYDYLYHALFRGSHYDFFSCAQNGLQGNPRWVRLIGEWPAMGPWLPKESEMKNVVTVHWEQFNNPPLGENPTDETLIARLLSLTAPAGGAGMAEFMGSHTRTAFIRFFREIWIPMDRG